MSLPNKKEIQKAELVSNKQWRKSIETGNIGDTRHRTKTQKTQHRKPKD